MIVRQLVCASLYSVFSVVFSNAVGLLQKRQKQNSQTCILGFTFNFRGSSERPHGLWLRAVFDRENVVFAASEIAQ